MITWRASSPRGDELLIPIIDELGPDKCTVLYESPSVVDKAPSGAALVQLFAVLPYEPAHWAPEFRRCWPAWKRAMKRVCRQYDLSAAMYERLALELVHGTQLFAGARQLLESLRPAAIVTEFDRSSRWSCLVLAARSLGIPTFTLQHGVIHEQGVGYVPVIADKIFCWGETARNVLVQCGVSHERIVLAGCPRLDRQLPVAQPQARMKLKLDATTPVVMLATAPYAESERTRLVEMFAACMERLPAATGIVRLHPSEKLEEYGELAKSHPVLRFFDNRAASLDESLSAANVVVIHNSGIGSDALVKGRLAIVVDLPPAPLGHGRELFEDAGCPCVKTADELLAAVQSLLITDAAPRHAEAERFVKQFCAHFGRDSARQIARTVEAAIAQRSVRSEGDGLIVKTKQRTMA